MKMTVPMYLNFILMNKNNYPLCEKNNLSILKDENGFLYVSKADISKLFKLKGNEYSLKFINFYGHRTIIGNGPYPNDIEECLQNMEDS